MFSVVILIVCRMVMNWIFCIFWQKQNEYAGTKAFQFETCPRRPKFRVHFSTSII